MDIIAIILFIVVIPTVAFAIYVFLSNRKQKVKAHVERMSAEEIEQIEYENTIHDNKQQRNRGGGCLKPIMIFFLIVIAISVLSPNRNSNTLSSQRTKQAATATPTHAPTNTPKPTRTPQPKKAPVPTATSTATPKLTKTPVPTNTPAVPGTYRPGIEGTNAYDIIGALKALDIETPRRQTVTDGYYWWTGNLTEGDVDYNIEIETDEEYRVTTMQIMMHGGNNNFVWWACACMYGEDSERVTWLKENMWNDATTTKTFDDDIWTIVPMEKGVYLTVQHVDAEKWYMSMI